MSQTPYEKKLLSLAVEASTADDFATVELVGKMIALLHDEQYADLQIHFPYLRPSHRIRVGAPPLSREQDEAAARGPGTTH